MVSQTFIARDIFSAIWNLGILGALQSAKAVHFPFDEQLQTFIEKKSTEFNELLRSVQHVCGFSKEVMSIATDASPWNAHVSTVPYDRDRLNGELLLAIHEFTWIEFDYDDHDCVRDIVHRGTEQQLIEILDGSIQAHFCFQEGKIPFAEAIEETLGKAIAFASTAFDRNDSKLTIKQVIQTWIDQNRRIEPTESKKEYDYEKWRIEVAIPEMT